MARLTNEKEQIKLDILNEISKELKEKSTAKKNYFTANNLLELANQRLKLEGITQISPNSLKGKKKAKYLEKYSDEIKIFKKEIRGFKNKYNNHLYNRIDDLEQQVQNLILDLVKYKDNYMVLEKNYEKLKDEYEYQKDKKNLIMQKYENLKKTHNEN